MKFIPIKHSLNQNTEILVPIEFVEIIQYDAPYGHYFLVTKSGVKYNITKETFEKLKGLQ